MDSKRVIRRKFQTLVCQRDLALASPEKGIFETMTHRRRASSLGHSTRATLSGSNERGDRHKKSCGHQLTRFDFGM